MRVWFSASGKTRENPKQCCPQRNWVGGKKKPENSVRNGKAKGKSFSENIMVLALPYFSHSIVLWPTATRCPLTVSKKETKWIPRTLVE